MTTGNAPPFDSLVVLVRPRGDGVGAAVLADILGDDLAAALARSPRLRVPCAEFVRPYVKSELSPEEIGRALNVRAVAYCTVATANGSVDATVELIDVLYEELIAEASFLVSARELLALQRAVARVIAPELPRWQPCARSSCARSSPSASTLIGRPPRRRCARRWNKILPRRRRGRCSATCSWLRAVRTRARRTIA